eukprot:m.392650 g.392650  ORF g.392650 m.392650 type:complete len:288 (+) comp56353_c0_seq2:1845-2708(+)
MDERGVEHAVEQRSAAWLRLRQRVLITASNVGSLVGRDEIGSSWLFHTALQQQKPALFAPSLLQAQEDRTPLERTPQDQPLSDSSSDALREHGMKMEPVLAEAYELLTGLHTRSAGFFQPHPGHRLHSHVGASPDRMVLDRETHEVVGLVEFKAPMFKMYSAGRTDVVRGIPAAYLTQMQMQMAVVGVRTWCDFFAICVQTREIMLQRVHFSSTYWAKLEAAIWKYACCAQKGIAPNYLKTVPRPDLAEDEVSVNSLLFHDAQRGRFIGPSRIPLSLEFLLGVPPVY